ncbi:MAG: hypothetical protein AAF604_00320 [Acidobacteriota bacterium]
MNTRNLLLVAAIAVALALTAPAFAGKGQIPQLPEDTIETCICTKAATIDVPGLGTFDAQLRGSISVGSFNVNVATDGTRNLPLNVKGYNERGYVDGLGETTVWLDKSRPVTGSFLREITPGTGFPAVQEMHMHFMMITEGLPGRMFRTLEPVILRSEAVDSFPPPKGTRYEPVTEVVFEDVENPGVLAVRITDVSVKVAGAD